MIGYDRLSLLSGTGGVPLVVRSLGAQGTRYMGSHNFVHTTRRPQELVGHTKSRACVSDTALALSLVVVGSSSVV
jgi:hypothetical protein